MKRKTKLNDDDQIRFHLVTGYMYSRGLGKVALNFEKTRKIRRRRFILCTAAFAILATGFYFVIF